MTKMRTGCAGINAGSSLFFSHRSNQRSCSGRSDTSESFPKFAPVNVALKTCAHGPIMMRSSAFVFGDRESVEVALDVVVVPAADGIDGDMDFFKCSRTLCAFQKAS